MYIHAERRGEKGGVRALGGGGTFWKWKDTYNDLTLADKLKPIRATVLLVEESFAVGELPCLTSFAFRRIRTVEVGNMLVAYVAEPNCTQVGLVLVYLVLRWEKKNSYERKGV